MAEGGGLRELGAGLLALLLGCQGDVAMDGCRWSAGGGDSGLAGALVAAGRADGDGKMAAVVGDLGEIRLSILGLG